MYFILNLYICNKAPFINILKDCVVIIFVFFTMKKPDLLGNIFNNTNSTELSNCNHIYNPQISLTKST